VKFYQDGKRKNPVMVSVANSLNEKQLDALAAYFGSLPKPKSKDKKARR
jgi:cytochrome c553